MMRSLFVLIVSFGIGACSHKTVTTTTKTIPTNYSLNTIIDKVNRNSIQSKWIQAKGQLSIDGGGFFSSGNMNIRSSQDSLIWISLTKLGIEIGRGLIRSDSAFITNDWENTYWIGSLSEVSKKYNVPATLSDMQSLIFPFLDPTAQYIGEQKNESYELTRQGQPNKRYSISTDSEMLIKNLLLTSGSAELKVKYDNYQKQNGYWFPYLQQQQFTQDNVSREASIKFNQISTSSALNTPFHIPSDYTLIK